jgi:hypothetical protein
MFAAIRYRHDETSVRLLDGPRRRKAAVPTLQMSQQHWRFSISDRTLASVPRRMTLGIASGRGSGRDQSERRVRSGMIGS